jgi:hypothetical protein
MTRSRVRARVLAPVLALLAAAPLGVVGASRVFADDRVGALTVTGDADGDGLDDGLEDELAQRFLPWVWFDRGEDAGCADPATPTNPGTVLARVRPHPADPGKVAIMYAVLFRRDCGDWFGGGHSGDVEALSVTLAPNAGCPTGYAAFALKTTAHEGTAFQHTDEAELGNTCDWGRAAGASSQWARVYAAENKHGIYAWDSTCDSGAAGNDNCSESFTLPFNVANVGEDHARRIDELSAYQFPGEYAWSDVPFSGSLDRGSNAQTVRRKLTMDSLLARTTQPPPSTRCNQRATAWYQNPGGAPTVRHGQSILVIAAGVMPGENAVFVISRDGTPVASHVTRWANSNCVINQEYRLITAAAFPAGTYRVTAYFKEPSSLGGWIPRQANLPDLVVTA